MRSASGSMSSRAVLSAAILATCFCSGLAVAPVLEARGIPSAHLLRDAYAPLCHQLPARTLGFGERPLPVCARCAGLYGGGVVALFLAWLFPLLGRSAGGRALAIAFVPTILDASVRLFGRSGVGNGPRLLLALPAGFVAGLLLAEGIADLAALALTRRFPMAAPGSRGSVPGRP